MAGKLSNIRVKEFPDLNLDFEVMSPIEIGLTDLPDIKVGVTDLPDIRFGITELPAINFNLAVTELPTLDIKTDSDLRTTSTVETRSVFNSNNSLDTSLDLRVTELPRIDLQFGFRPMRFHFPLNFRFCVTLFGIRVFQLETCGEAMIVSEDYRPLESEVCQPEASP